MADERRETVYNDTPPFYYDNGSTIGELKAWLDSQIEKIPEEFRGTETVRIGGDSDFDGSYRPSIEITYLRPMTSAEIERVATMFERNRVNEIRRLHSRLRELEQPPVSGD